MDKRKITKLIYYTCIVILAALFLLPIYILVTTSIKTPEQIFVSPVKWIPIKEYT